MINKAIMAAAVAGALAAPGLALAQASTAGTNVQIYGAFDVRWDWMKVSGGTAAAPGDVKKTHLSTGAPNRIGFRGTENLGGGMQAFFQVETQVFTDARQDAAAQQHTNATLGGRPTFVGLRSGWGELSAGYQESPYKDVYITSWSVLPTQPHFGVIMGNGNTSGGMPTPSCNGLTASGSNNFQGVSSTTGSATTAVAQTPVSATTPATVRDAVLCTEAPGNGTSFNRTMADSVTYRTPVIAGFRFSTMLTANENREPSSATPAGGNRSDQRFGAYSVTWSAGPLSLAGAFEQHTGFRATNTGVTAATPANRAARDRGMAFGARFNYGAGLVGLGYERLKYGNSAIAGAATDNSFSKTNWVINGTFNLTPSDTIGAGYSKTQGNKDCGAGVVCGTTTGAKLFSVSIDHAFSKRTAVYAYYSKLDNNSAANYNYISDSRTTSQAAGVGSGYALGQDSKNFNVGVKHTF
jgi:predicted porin